MRMRITLFSVLAVLATMLSGVGLSAGAVTSLPVPPAPTAPAAAGPICYFGACYSYVYGRQVVDAAGARVVMPVEQPELDPADNDGHSLQELAVESADGQQIVEVGWTVDRGLNGDAEPHLFTFHWVDGVPTCYNTCGFVSTLPSFRPGHVLPTGGVAEFGISYRRGRWEITYGNLLVGYYRGALWGGRFTRLGLVQAFGEVASTGTPTCTDMGDGRRGGSARSSYIEAFHLTGTHTPAQLTVVATVPGQYSSGQVQATSYHLGGPGSGACAG